jgi:acetolactate synthase-1/2/3 large subunit
MAAGLMEAKRCMLLLGQGCDDAGAEAARLAERLGAVVVTTTSGRGVVAEDHPRSLGFALAGNDAGVLNALIEASDVVLAVGCKFSHNGSRGFRLRIPTDKLMHVDASSEVLDANYPARIAVRAYARACIAALLDALGSGNADGFTLEEIAQWRLRCVQEKARGTVEPCVHGVPGGTPVAFFAALRSALPRESCLVTDSGRHQQLARRHFPVLCARGLITPTNLQSMGFGIGAAMGAKLADPSRPVVALIGDGGLAMSGLELLTAVREGIDLAVIVFVDGAYGAIRDQQILNHGYATGTEFAGPDCAALAEAIGARHVRLRMDAEATLKSAIESPGVTLVEVALGDTLPMHWTRAKAVAKARWGRRLKGWWQARRR